MRNYPHLMNRKGHYYFRIAVPLSLVPNLGKKELTYSLKTQDYTEAKIRSLNMLNIAQDAFREAHAGKVIAIDSLKECLNNFTRYGSRSPLNALPMPSIPAPIAEPFPPTKELKNMVSVVFEAYIAECKGDRTKTIDKKRGIFATWLKIIGDDPIEAINKEKTRQFKTMLMKLPANLKQRYGDKAIKDIDLEKIPEAQRLSVGSINDKLAKMTAFMNWAIKNGYYNAANPFIGLNLKDAERPEDKKHSFTDEQLKAIFSTPVYRGCQSDNMMQRYERGNLLIKDGMYWVPLIALYSGARLQEICQLYTADLKQQGDIWVFDFNEDGQDKQLKTLSSQRKTPVHPKLIELGLLQHFKAQTDKGEERLFPDLPLSSDGTYSGAFSKRFNHFLVRFKIKTDKTSFHSFRHTFIDGLRNTNVHKEVREALVGHLDKRTAHDTYGSAIGIQRLYEGIVQLEYKLSF